MSENPGTTSFRYGSVQIALHWTMLLLIAAAYACIELRELYPKGTEIREALKTWHYMLGLAVFGLIWIRLAARLLGAVPPIVPTPPAWQLFLAHTGELVMYVFMVAMPLLGWLILSAGGDRIPFFGLQLPPLIAENEQLGKQLEEVHELAGTIGYFVIGIHAAAALAHHYLRHDNTLTRMLPCGKSQPNRGAQAQP